MRPKRELIAPPARLAVGAQVEVHVVARRRTSAAAGAVEVADFTAQRRNIAAGGRHRQPLARGGGGARASAQSEPSTPPQKKPKPTPAHKPTPPPQKKLKASTPPRRREVDREAPDTDVRARPSPSTSTRDKVELHAAFAHAVLEISAVRAQRVRQKFLGTPKERQAIARAQSRTFRETDRHSMYYVRARQKMIREMRGKGERRPRAASNAEAQAVVFTTYLFRLYNRMSTFVLWRLLRKYVTTPDTAKPAGVGGGARLAHQGGPRRVRLRAARVQ